MGAQLSIKVTNGEQAPHTVGYSVKIGVRHPVFVQPDAKINIVHMVYYRDNTLEQEAQLVLG